MSDDLTIQDYRDILSDKMRLIRDLNSALLGDAVGDDLPLSGLIDAANDMRVQMNQRDYEIERLRKALENISVAHIETETEFSQAIKSYSRAMIGGGRVVVPDTPENRANPILGYPPLDLSPAFH